MRELPEIPDEDVAEYWQLVRAALVAGGVSKKEAVAMAKAYREYMKPASWTIYNTDPEDSAEAAKDYAAWMREEAEHAAMKSKGTQRNAIPTDGFPTEWELSKLTRWARVAISARCASRVEPVFRNRVLKTSFEKSLLVRRAINFAEQAARTATTCDDHSAFVSLIGDVNHVPQAGESIASIAFDAVNSAFGYESGNRSRTKASSLLLDTAKVCGPMTTKTIGEDFRLVMRQRDLHKWTDATPVPPAVFGPLWPEGPPADWPELPKPTKVKLNVQVPDHLDDAAVREKLQKLTTALARLNVAGGGHGLKLIPPVEFTHEQDKGRADVVREEGEKPKGRGNARRGH